MNPLTKLYLRTFLLTGIPYGIMMVGFDLMDGGAINIWKFLFLSISFGLLMSLTLVGFHRYRLRKSGVKDMDEASLAVRQEKMIQSPLNLPQAMKALESDQKTRRMKMTEIQDGIRLKTPVTWKSWGEDVQIIRLSEEDGTFEYQITSRPKVKTTIVDYGKNTENIALIESILAE